MLDFPTPAARLDALDAEIRSTYIEEYTMKMSVSTAREDGQRARREPNHITHHRCDPCKGTGWNRRYGFETCPACNGIGVDVRRARIAE